MRIVLLFLFGLFIQTSSFAQAEGQDLKKGTEDIQQEMQKQLKELGFLFGDSDMLNELLQNFNLGELNLEELNLQDLEQQLGDGGMMMPNDLDMQGMMELFQKGMQGQGMDLEGLEQLLGPMMGGDLGLLFPQTPKKDEPILKGEDGQPIQQNKKSKKKVYKL